MRESARSITLAEDIVTSASTDEVLYREKRGEGEIDGKIVSK